MFSARAYSFRQKSRLAISLSWVAGYANVTVFMVCGIYVSHMTGNTTSLGKSISEGAVEGIVLFGSLFLSFLLGAAVSAFLTESARRIGSASKYVLPLALEAALLLLLIALLERFGIASAQALPAKLLIGCLASAAMGLQNATITKISGAVVRTTHVTGVITDLGIEGVQCLLWLRDRLRNRRQDRVYRTIRVARRQPEFQRVALLATILGSFLFGAAAGAGLFLRIHGIALLFPVLFLVWMIWVDWRAPIADVREIDLFGDHELKLHGIMKSLLPPEMGIWRVFCKHNGTWHKAPDFEAWVEIMPRRWRVIVLSLSPLTRLDANALLNLAAATRKLREQDRRLVLAGVSDAQYRAVTESDAGRLLEPENVCPDLEFAIARGIELVRESVQNRTANGRESARMKGENRTAKEHEGPRR